MSVCRGGNVKLVKNEKNNGGAVTLHDGICYAQENGYRYVLTLDQDSILQDGAVNEFKKIFAMDEKIALCGANVNGTMKCLHGNALITSGTMADVEKVLGCGNYDRKLFIDLVDYDICSKVLRGGYKLTLCQNVKLIHNFGEQQKRKCFGRKIFIFGYSPQRIFLWQEKVRY